MDYLPSHILRDRLRSKRHKNAGKSRTEEQRKRISEAAKRGWIKRKATTHVETK